MDSSQKIDLAIEKYSENKIIPDPFRHEILTALSFYPELQHTCIRFTFKDNIRKSFMQAQPVLSSMFNPIGKREYVINMSRYFKIGREKIYIEDVPSEVIIGWVGHELGHIMDYKDRSLWSMIKFGIGYLFSRPYLMEAERVADTYAIQHGLAEYIIETKNFILNHAQLPEKYKAKIRKFYMPPEEVMLMIEPH